MLIRLLEEEICPTVFGASLWYHMHIIFMHEHANAPHANTPSEPAYGSYYPYCCCVKNRHTYPHEHAKITAPKVDT